MNASFPLSRFALNKSSIQIDFAVGGAEHNSSVYRRIFGNMFDMNMTKPYHNLVNFFFVR